MILSEEAEATQESLSRCYEDLSLTHSSLTLPYGSAYQAGDNTPKGIPSFSSQATMRASTGQEGYMTANQHMSKSLQLDAPASPCVLFPGSCMRLTSCVALITATCAVYALTRAWYFNKRKWI